MLDRVPDGCGDDPCVRLAAVAVSRRQRCRPLLLRHARQHLAYPLTAVLEIADDLGSGLSPRQGRQRPVWLPREWRTPRPEFAGQVVVEALEGVPCHAPRGQASLDHRAARLCVNHGLPIGAGRIGSEQVCRNLPHAGLPKPVRAPAHGVIEQFEGRFEAPAEAFKPRWTSRRTVTRHRRGDRGEALTGDHRPEKTGGARRSECHLPSGR